MSLDRHVVRSLELSTIRTHYPRTVGRNARLGSHGNGGVDDIVILRTDTGKAGWGLVAGPVSAEQVVGRSVADLIDPGAGVRDDALRGLDFALHDLAGQLLDLPVHAMLGGHGPRTVPCYDGAIYFADLDPDDDPRGLPAVLADCAADDDAAGYRAFKLKIGRGNRWLDRAAGDARDIEVTRAVREAYPDHRILVDANDGYDCAGFLEYLDAVAECDLYWVEEPFADDAADLARLRSHLRDTGSATLIAEGETDPELEALLEIAGRGDLDVLLMDVVSFGLTSWRSVMPRIAELGVRASPHAWGLPVKTLYAAQLAAGLGCVDTVEGVPGDTAGVDTSGYRWRDGELTVPDRPGFGLSLDQAGREAPA